MAAAALTVTAWIGSTGQASAEPACAHRGAEHAAQHHETREGDSRWHVLHGDLPTCNLDKPDDTDDHDHEHDDPRWFPRDEHPIERHDDDHPEGVHRDHEGLHCYHLHCG